MLAQWIESVLRPATITVPPSTRLVREALARGSRSPQGVGAGNARAVWVAYGWPEDEVPAEVEEAVILSRLLELNQERAAASS